MVNERTEVTIMRLIDADNVRGLFDAEFKATRKLILAGETHLDNLAEGFVEADRVIRAMPTVDAEVVVYCKDCKYYDRCECYHPRHERHLQSICQKDDDFCSYGERKEEM